MIGGVFISFAWIARITKPSAVAVKVIHRCVSHNAHSVKIDAMTLLGTFLKNGHKNKGGNPRLTGTKREPVQKLKENGISKKESSISQFLSEQQGTALYEEIRGNRMAIPKARRQINRKEASSQLLI